MTIYWLRFGGRFLTTVKGENLTDNEVRNIAGSRTSEHSILCNRPLETPLEFRSKLYNAEVVNYDT